MGSLMDDEDDIANKVVERTLGDLVNEALYSEQWTTYIKSLIFSTMFREIQSLNDRINELEGKVADLVHIMSTSEYTLDKTYNSDGELHDVFLIRKQSDY